MPETLVALFDHPEDAYAAVEECKKAGIDSRDLSLIARDPRLAEELQAGLGDLDQDDSTGRNAAQGAAVGAGVGLLAGLSAIVLPVIGPAVALGIAGTGAVIGAGAAGMITSIDQASTAEEDAGFYKEGLRRGGAVVMVRAADPALREQASSIFHRHRMVDMQERIAQWKEQGWSGYDPDAPAYEMSPDNPVRRRPGDMRAA